MKKTIKDFNLKDKKVIIRCDFNVPIKDGIIKDDNRIKESIKTINYAINKGAKVILLSHLGRVKTEEDLVKNDLKPVADRLAKLLDRKVTFIDKTRGKEVEETVNNMKNKQVVLLQNTRYEDLKEKKESTNNKELGKYWASLGDIFINDAFGTCHRTHASNVGIANNLPNGLGFLTLKEIKMLDKANNPKKPFIVILGGAKVEDKIKVIQNLAQKADYLLIGGGMAYTFLKAAGFNVGNSLIDKNSLSFCSEMLKKYENKIILPIDIVASEETTGKNIKTIFINEFNDEMGLDIGPKTVKIFKQYIREAKTVFLNGPLGMFEIKEFSNGTKEILKYLSEQKKVTIIGGGDTASAAINFGYKDDFTHISTGGGASLEYLEGKELPAIGVINEI